MPDSARNGVNPSASTRPTSQNIITPLGTSTVPEIKGAGEKVRIPRAPTRAEAVTRVRTKHACEACRRRRIKCDGGRPVCQGCLATNTKCVYSDHKRVRDRQEMKQLRSTIDNYEHLLRDLLYEVPASTAKRIKLTLAHGGSNPENHDPSLSSSSTSSTGSVQGIDTIAEDLNRNEESRATGFMGKNSVLAWLRNLESNSRMTPDQRVEAMGGWQFDHPIRPQPDLNTVSYFLDDKELPESGFVDWLDLPPRQVADWAVWSYFKSVHPFFPIVRKSLFLEQYSALWETTSDRPGQKWLAIFNMILAIGCRQLQCLQEPLPTEVSDEVFFSRARILSVNENMTFEHADLQQVQVEALVALYFMVSMQINRAWKVSGIAVRSAMALAINLQITDSELHHTSKEARSRLWWSIYMLENLLSHMTGRPTCIGSNSFSVKQPVPFDEDAFEKPQVVELLTNETIRRQCLKWSLDEEDSEEQTSRPYWLQEVEPTQCLQFLYLVDLMHIVHAAIGELFSPTGFQASRSYIKRRIRFYDKRMDQWLSRLHPAFQFIDDDDLTLHRSSQEQIVLALHHYSARITLYRPCSPFRRCSSSKEKEYRSISQRCLHAALCLISIFPDAFSLDWVYNVSPWWCILHFLMQASTILILFSQRGDDAHFGQPPTFVDNSHDAGGEKKFRIRSACLKAHRWLEGLSGVDESCRRAFLLYDGLARRAGLINPWNSMGEYPSSGYRHDISTAEGARSQHQVTIRGDMRPPDTLSSIDWNNIETSAPLNLVEVEGLDENLTGVAGDLMTDNYTQWIRTALEDDDEEEEEEEEPEEGN